MKKCKDCRKEKSLSDFYPTQGECKECTRDRVKKNRLANKSYYDTYDQKRNREDYRLICLRKYSMMKGRILGTGSHHASCEGKELLSKDEFMQWAKESEQSFKNIQSAWRRSRYQRRLAPSIDRINNSLGYSKGNLQWLPLYLNIRKDIIGSGWQQRPRNEKGQFGKIKKP